ncbi:MAG: hypothetical protein IPP62_10065 [bacterium]|nr:hypothetical protein [bacterium]
MRTRLEDRHDDFRDLAHAERVLLGNRTNRCSTMPGKDRCVRGTATMKTVIAHLLAGSLVSGAVAGLDASTDSFGVYFDLAGNTNCIVAEAMQPIAAHLILMNPAGPTNGFECSVAITGAPHFVLSTSFGATCIDGIIGSGPDDFITGCATNFPVPDTGAMRLATLQILLLEPSELLFRIGPASSPSLPGGLPVVSGDGVLRLCRVASGDVSLPVAGINAANCPVSEEIDAFGSVKSLFR